jgi:DNA-binding response OmpR family regulator
VPGSGAARPAVVAVINTTPDAIDMLKDAFERAGFVVATALTWMIQAGETNLEGFLHTHEPDVIVYDLAPPYEKNWLILQNLRHTLLKGYRFVLTSVNTKHVETLVGRDEQVYEVVGTPHDLDQIVRAVREATKARPVR